jgi:hypothetical protein
MSRRRASNHHSASSHHHVAAGVYRVLSLPSAGTSSYLVRPLGPPASSSMCEPKENESMNGQTHAILSATKKAPATALSPWPSHRVTESQSHRITAGPATPPTLVAVSPGVVEITISYGLRKGSPRIPRRRLRFLLRVSDAAAPNLLPRSVPPRPPFVLRP